MKINREANLIVGGIFFLVISLICCSGGCCWSDGGGGREPSDGAMGGSVERIDDARFELRFLDRDMA